MKGTTRMKHVKYLSSLALIAAMGVSLSACGGSTAATAPTSPSVESIAPAAVETPKATEPKRSPRGNIIKTLNEGGSITNEEGKTLASFAVSSISVDAPCTGPYPDPKGPENGHIVVLDVSIETTPELGAADSYPTTFDLNPYSFKFVGANGTTFNGKLATGATFGCLPDEQVLSSSGVGPAEKVTGKVVLDIPETTGVLVFKPGFMNNGWEWNF
jgi:hypothetical protein